ncbi:multidrug resistance protein ABC superfamily [Phytophthora sojae]|uniref:Multidrug resistance protein ABC superfamily n=1 Tax=Phytophthora sojae (strain P6497) TaxID=1094619 RepID=G5A429_PHYSP|nr:multidrug resistance protein ABC superfamily [Phytophthora sojae]EGZ10289.1 multidrug resistance protein ABC superfamily [Phytophthora sojae]|eukprot:XP_009535150.1 multidrug resistance protein ABC superfamily [Phytophthora sojae]
MAAPSEAPASDPSPPYVEVHTPRLSQAGAAATKLLTDEDAASTTSAATAPSRKQVPLLELFCFADSTDKLLMAVGTLGAICAGALRPVMVLLFGSLINSFGSTSEAGGGPSDISPSVNRVARNLTIVGAVGLATAYLQVYCWTVTASRQSKRIRSLYVNAIVTKEIAWFDVNEPMQLSSRVADATVTIQDGIGSKMSDMLHFTSTVVSGIVIAFIKGWELALILLAVVPFVATSGMLAKKVIVAATHSGMQSYAEAGAVAQESLSNIRTVHMFNSVPHFVDKYSRALEGATSAGIKKAFAVGWGSGLTYMMVFLNYALGFFIGAVFIARDNLGDSTCTGSGCYNGGRVLTVFFTVMQGAMALGQAGPNLQAVYSACAAAYDVFELIKRPSLIDPTNDDEGKKLQTVSGNIDIDDVRFAYPSRPEVDVCRGYSLQIKAGETVALVGPSGSGKSTVVSLLERFYDPLEGSVKIDGEDVRSLNVKWLRQQIGLVGQEPVLFATTIMENIRHGRPAASDSEVVEAAKMANAFSFIMEFPEGFATEVGERGAQLSGGQKQRIAIARAIIKNPPILLLDEATSALDTESERIVQASLDQLVAGLNRTTIIVAHRLSTIRDADRIAVHSGGRIVELGSHEELLRIPNGHYRRLLEAQTQAATEGDTTESTPVMDGAASTDLNHEDSHLVRSTRASSKSSALELGDYNGSDASECECDNVDTSAVSSLRIWKMGLPEWKFMALGGISSVFKGSVYPLAGMFIAKIIHLYFELQKTKHEMLHDMRYYSLALGCLAVVCGSSFTLTEYWFGIASSRLISRVRLEAYSGMMRQEVGWFDLKENSSGSLVSRLATDSAILQSMTSDFLNRSLMTGTTFIIIFAIAFYYSWQMTLIMIATTPFLVGVNRVRLQHMAGQMNAKKNNDADTAAASLLSEAIDSIRTVASFGMEKALVAQYTSFLNVSNEQDKKVGVSGGVSFGLSQAMTFWVLAFVFYIGGIWVSHGTISFEDLLVVLMVFMMGSFSVSMASQGSVDGEKAKRAVANVFNIIDRVPEIDATSTAGTVLPRIQGDIDFKQLTFAYPSRPHAAIYQGYDLSVRRGQTVALVGASGSGKSTAIALLERFYDPSSGAVTLDGHDVRSLSLPWLRDRISLVSQEPVLFSGTIADNIALGKPGASRAEVEAAARSANAFDFISNFPRGFDTEVGDRGAQVSGGQKQRIAIARAILRDPDVLLLDEATSALDNESEQVVQASLDALMAQKRRTTIVVAHRLSTIRKADVIAVTRDGAIVERGSHEELMRVTGGVYRGMVELQSMTVS